MSVLGIDIGGSKTHALLVRDGVRVAEAFSGSANILAVGVEEAARQLEELAGRLAADRVDGATAPGEDRDVAVVCVGAAGVDTPGNRAVVHELIARHWPAASVRIVHDTELVLAAAGLTEGAVVISGTGSAAWGRNAEGEQVRTGGWGFMLGDEGSGYGIVRAAVRHALDLSDDGRPPDELAGRLLAATGVAGAPELLDRFYRRPRPGPWARHSHLVFELAAAGHEPSTGIVRAAAAELVQAAARVCRRLGLAGPVVLAGGVVLNQPLLRDVVTELLAGAGVHDVRMLTRDPVHGAVELALTASRAR